MISTWPRGTLGSIAHLLATTLYQGNPERNHKLWNIVSTEKYILHMQVLLAGMMLQINGKFTMGKLACDVHIQWNHPNVKIDWNTSVFGLNFIVGLYLRFSFLEGSASTGFWLTEGLLCTGIWLGSRIENSWNFKPWEAENKSQTMIKKELYYLKFEDIVSICRFYRYNSELDIKIN